MKTKIAKIVVAKDANMEIALLVFRILAAFALLRTHGIPKMMEFNETPPIFPIHWV